MHTLRCDAFLWRWRGFHPRLPRSWTQKVHHTFCVLAWLIVDAIPRNYQLIWAKTLFIRIMRMNWLHKLVSWNSICQWLTRIWRLMMSRMIIMMELSMATFLNSNSSLTIWMLFFSKQSSIFLLDESKVSQCLPISFFYRQMRRKPIFIIQMNIWRI